MNIISDPSQDSRHGIQQPGGYEWWYFDAISTDGRHSLVVIFYEGNPFSPSYINAQQGRSNEEPLPQNFPAVSISVYEDGNPIYYSFTEYSNEQCTFDSEHPFVKIGRHSMRAEEGGEKLRYSLHLQEALPSGDKLQVSLEFGSDPVNLRFDDAGEQSVGHQWNLVQPRSEVNGDIHIETQKGNKTISFEGRGYHDHNIGHEPMRDEFSDWYWGRLHFSAATLVYYVMNRKATHQHCAWLIDSEHNIVERFSDITLSDTGRSIFGLSMAHKIDIQSEHTQIQIQQSNLLDNGPFYRRFLSDGLLKVDGQTVPEPASGITEYIRPDRIYSRIFWPLVNMRIRRDHKKAHWVQRSSRLYRWTW